MSVDVPSRTYLVCDTSAFIQSLPLIKAVTDSHLPYTVYVPYVVLNELDRGRSAGPVNRMLCEHLKKKSTRLSAQAGDSHQDVFIAKGITPKNDDFIMGAALQLRDAGHKIVMVTNDNNLSAKCIANEVTSWSSLDLFYNLPSIVSVLNRTIRAEIQKLCPNTENTFRFVTVLISCALKFELRTKVGSDVSQSYHIDDLIASSTKNELGQVSLLKALKEASSLCRRKGRLVSLSSMRVMLERAVKALESFKDKENTTSSIVTTLRNILNGLPARSEDRKPEETVQRKRKIPSYGTKEKIGNEAPKAELKTIKKRAKRRRKLRSTKTSEESAESDVEMGDVQIQDAGSSGAKAESEMECDVATGQSHVYQALDSVWKRLDVVVGSWAKHFDVDYDSKSIIYPGIKHDLPRGVDLELCVAKLEDSYNRLLKLSDVVSLDLRIEIAKKLIASMREVWPIPLLDPKVVVEFFKDHSTRETLQVGHDQLKTFMVTIAKCCGLKTKAGLEHSKRASEIENSSKRI